MASAAQGDHRSMPRAKVEISEAQLRAVCKRFAQEISKMKILGDEEAVTEGNTKFLTAIARHTARFPSIRALAKIAGAFVPECSQSELTTWASAVAGAFKHCQDRYNRKVKKMMPAISTVVNAMRERDDEHNVHLPILPSLSPEPEDSTSAPPTFTKKAPKRSLHEIRAAYGLSPQATVRGVEVIDSSPEEERPSARRRLSTKSPSKTSASSSAPVPKALAGVAVQVPEGFHIGIHAQSTP